MGRRGFLILAFFSEKIRRREDEAFSKSGKKEILKQKSVYALS